MRWAIITKEFSGLYTGTIFEDLDNIVDVIEGLPTSHYCQKDLLLVKKIKSSDFIKLAEVPFNNLSPADISLLYLSILK